MAWTDWDFDNAHSSADFGVRHMMVTRVRGHLGTITGSVTLDDAHLARSSAQPKGIRLDNLDMSRTMAQPAGLRAVRPLRRPAATAC